MATIAEPQAAEIRVPPQYASLIRDELEDQVLSLQDELRDLREIFDKGEEPPSGYSVQQTEDKTERLRAIVQSLFDSERRVMRGDREGVGEILFKAVSSLADRLSEKAEPLDGILTAEVRESVDVLEWLAASLEQIGVEAR